MDERSFLEFSVVGVVTSSGEKISDFHYLDKRNPES